MQPFLSFYIYLRKVYSPQIDRLKLKKRRQISISYARLKNDLKEGKDRCRLNPKDEARLSLDNAVGKEIDIRRPKKGTRA